MSAYGSIGFTRPDKTPPHWRKDYRLRPKAKQLLAEVAAEKKRLFREHDSLPDDLSDEAYSEASRELMTKLDALTDRMDEIRRTNPA